jgi:hypothetical protein
MRSSGSWVIFFAGREAERRSEGRDNACMAPEALERSELVDFDGWVWGGATLVALRAENAHRAVGVLLSRIDRLTRATIAVAG